MSTTTSCSRCGAEKHRGRCKRTRDQKRSPSSPAEIAGFTVPMAYGVRTSIVEGSLCLAQDRFDESEATTYTHTIYLAPHEARRLIEWAQDAVEIAEAV